MKSGRKEKKNRKKSVLYAWSLSYLLVLLLPVIAVFANYYFNVRVIRKEIYHANELILNNFADSVDGYLKENRKLYSNAITNPEFDAWISHQEKDSYFYKDSAGLYRQLNNYRVYSLNYSCFLYFTNFDYVLNPNGGYDKGFYYSTMQFYHTDMISQEKWTRIMTKDYDRAYFVLDFWHHKTVEPCLVYAHTVSYYQNKVNVFAGFPLSVIEKLAQNMEEGTKVLITVDGNPFLAIADGKTQILQNDDISASYTTTIPAEKNESAANGRGNVSIVKSSNTREYMEIRKESGENGICYYLQIPNRIFWQDARHVRNVLVVSLLLTLLAGMVCINIVLKRNFRPVSELLSKVEGSDSSKNEFEQLEESYMRMKKKNLSISEKMDSLSGTIRKNRLLELMKGGKAEAEDKRMFPFVEGQVSILLGMKVLPEKKCRDSNELILFVIDNIFSELLGEEHYARTEDGESQFYLFMVEEEKSADWKQNCNEKVNELIEILKKWNVNLIVAISNPEKSLERIADQYRDIRNVFENRQMVFWTSVAVDIEKQETEEAAAKLTIGNMIKEALQKRDTKEVMELADKFFGQDRQCSFSLLRMQCLEILMVAIKEFYESDVHDEAKIYLRGFMNSVLDMSDREQARKIVKEMLEYTCRILCEQDSDKEKKIVIGVKEFVAAHYMEESLNLITIAESMGLSTRHLGSVFREETGEGIPDYINRIRIEKAKMLLKNRDCSIEEICAKVGYSNSKTFRRVFVKMEGVTPGKFREEA